MIKGAENLFIKKDIKYGANRGTHSSFFSFFSKGKVDQNTGEEDQVKTVGYFKGLISCFNPEEK